MKKFTWNNWKMPRHLGRKTEYAVSTRVSMASVKPAINGPSNYMTALPRKDSHDVQQNTAFSHAHMTLEQAV